MQRVLLGIILCVFTGCWITNVSHVAGTLSKKDKKSKKGSEASRAGRPNTNVTARGLVVENPKTRDIIKFHSSYYKNVSEINFSGDVLVYVTPWNSHGYDVAKIFSPKFTYVSPVWLQVKRRKTGTFVVEGGHDIDQGWISDVKKGGNHVKIVLSVIVLEKSQGTRRISRCAGLYKFYFGVGNHFDGLTLEVWSQYTGDTKEDLYLLVSKMADSLHKEKLKIILVIPPPFYAGKKPGSFDKNDLELLAPVLDGFSLMTYDYSSQGRPGPNAPLQWMKDCVLTLSPEKGKHRSKILMGLNFYGQEFAATGSGRKLKQERK
ncbi:Chitinase domain-containing protein 1 [Stylophora pistillata]|uniref:Chitinase domain-containing protein 1 n=1 Tax=Stylophora pistillata TaxID=50429 RepID=A0A2B4RQ00_STYPI|nr:Chitinase domain-containing protein 1 [Stylophora pistillata]